MFEYEAFVVYHSGCEISELFEGVSQRYDFDVFGVMFKFQVCEIAEVIFQYLG